MGSIKQELLDTFTQSEIAYVNGTANMSAAVQVFTENLERRYLEFYNLSNQPLILKFRDTGSGDISAEGIYVYEGSTQDVGIWKMPSGKTYTGEIWVLSFSGNNKDFAAVEFF